MIGSIEDAFEPDMHFASSDEEDENEGPDVDELIWLAQMDLIGHRTDQAITRLRTAASLSSTAACVTLGNLLKRGSIRSSARSGSPRNAALSSTSKKVDRPSIKHAYSRLNHQDGLEAAALFVNGLEIELRKALKDPGSAEDSEEESAEGQTFSLERALDLAIGVTDSYTTFWGNVPTDSDERTLWDHGADIALQALQHPEICTTVDQGLNLSNSFPPPSLPSRGVRPLLSGRGSANRSESSTRKIKIAPARSYAHPSTSIPPPATIVSSSYKISGSHHLPPRLKLHLTIQVHLCYVLAIHHYYLRDDVKADKCWKDIVRISKNAGGSVGTREGDDIVAKSTHRLILLSNQNVDDSWKLAKRRKPLVAQMNESEKQTMINDGAEDLQKPGPVSKTRRNVVTLGREGSGDAILDMRLASKPSRGRHLATQLSAGTQESGARQSAEIKRTEDESRTVSMSAATEPSQVAPAPASNLEERRDSKATASYPSPPESPIQSPELSGSESARNGLKSPQGNDVPTRRHIRGARSIDSTAFPQLFKRVPSVASISTLADTDSLSDEQKATGLHSLERDPMLWRGWNAFKYPFQAVHSFMDGKRGDDKRSSVYFVLEKIQEADWQAIHADELSAEPVESPTGVVQPSDEQDTLSIEDSSGGPSSDIRPVPPRSRRKSVAMDPLLKELENASRVGVKTVCASCHRRGLNYPKNPRTGLTHCSRECRLKIKLVE